MKSVLTIIAALFIISSATSAKGKGDTYKVFYLGGQSNMDGYGYNKDLPDSLLQQLDDVYIFHGNSMGDDMPDGGLGIWAPLQTGHGVGFSSDGKKNTYSERFGLELSFAYKLKQLYPNDKIAIIKYSKGGSSIDSVATRQFGCWEPDFKGKIGINQYNHFLTTLKNAFTNSDINNDGKVDKLIPSGILWMQGESDADVTEDIALRYHANLKRLMDLIRASLHSNDLPIVIGKISDSWNDENGKVWPYGELVQYAQEKFVNNDINAAIIRDTRYYKYSDPWHYNSEGYIHLGLRMAEEMNLLLNSNSK
ncbi:sialate O-acetylesterase [Carboxylicivirga sp. N1Y90]|uniref:sialate O-acetylesterase n=1 Tax=Carboxylicivirga fragile TaxID=3417571 RepID=UPI003D34EC6C|nr:hypothetical protein [Marinilabiliaceae bacterium N1Y90]